MNNIKNMISDTVNISGLGIEIYGIIGVVGSFIASAYGGWNECMNTLVMFMAIDYITGIIVAGVFHTSKKTETGGLESRAGWKGLCRKGMTMLIVLIAARIDMTFGLDNIARNATAIGFISMECTSILENASLMGLPVPTAITNALDLLKKQADQKAKELKVKSDDSN